MPRHMTAQEFLRWEHNGIAEWVNGEVSIMAVTNEYQRMVDFLNRLLGIFVQAFGLGVVRSAPYAMRATPEGSIRAPDLMFVSAAHLDRVRREALDGPADLVVEVVSEESVARDYLAARPVLRLWASDEFHPHGIGVGNCATFTLTD